MSTYVIGDVQGCFDTLEALLRKIDYREKEDEVWLAGDLVNRGPRSLDVLRWAHATRGVDSVLGNHDMHLIARVEGFRASVARDTLDEILEASDRDELVDWLARRPLMMRQRGYVLVHAGLLPQWSVDKAERLAGKVQASLSSDRRTNLLSALYAPERLDRWASGLSRTQKEQVAADALTRLRTCTEDGRMCLAFSGPPGDAEEGCRPWFEWRGVEKETILFGHWAALGFYDGHGVIGLDSGCVWGRSLTALRLEDRVVFRVPSAEA